MVFPPWTAKRRHWTAKGGWRVARNVLPDFFCDITRDIIRTSSRTSPGRHPGHHSDVIRNIVLDVIRNVFRNSIGSAGRSKGKRAHGPHQALPFSAAYEFSRNAGAVPSTA
ncbi:hypothetical protein GCM10018785_74360 [Streptomyces longispororuber]|uniref:Uncharacterized protein n=1 Tax=Streptomyces longispororuber TaxID=68230 RepID=A0A919E169_9ACTN|nr:hypothetical protein GCM10018785_74360 [Streptomyces longispororuber]